MLRAGSVYINTWGAVDPSAPFGGFKASGLGPRARPRRPRRLPRDQDGVDGACEPRGVVNVAAQSELGASAHPHRALGAGARGGVLRWCCSRRPPRSSLDGAAGHSGADPQIAADRRLAVGDRRAPGLPRLSDRRCSSSRPPTPGCCALASRRRGISKRCGDRAVAALHAIVFVGPILLSTDVFSYIAYARMGVEHGLNPYLHGPIAISHDPVYHYVGHGLEARRDGLRPALHAALLSVRAARA